MLQAAVLVDGPTPEAVLPLLERIPAGHLTWPAAQILKARVLRDRELARAALRTMEQAVASSGETVRMLGLLASLHHSVGNVDRSLELHRRIIELRHDAAGSRRG